MSPSVKSGDFLCATREVTRQAVREGRGGWLSSPPMPWRRGLIAQKSEFTSAERSDCAVRCRSSAEFRVQNSGLFPEFGLKIG